MKNKCKNECKNHGAGCLDQHKSGFGCTRSEGHSGDHVACGLSKHDLELWKGEKNVKRNRS